jgi:hypothetical protein
MERSEEMEKGHISRFTTDFSIGKLSAHMHDN